MSLSSRFQRFNHKKIIIFDFDGVLADSFDYFYSLIKDAMAYVSLTLTEDQYRGFFIGNVHQGFKDFINNEKKYSLFSEFRKNNFNRYYYSPQGVNLFPEASGFLKKLGGKYILTVASSGYEENIRNLLKKNRVLGLFSLITANSATTKEGMIKKTMEKFGLKTNETIMITDTVGDLKVAKKTGIKTVAVTWGFHSAKTLESTKSDHLATNFEMLYKQLKDF